MFKVVWMFYLICVALYYIQWKNPFFTEINTALKQVIKYEGYGGLFRGLGSTLLRDVPFSGKHSFFNIYHNTKANITALRTVRLSPFNGAFIGLTSIVFTGQTDRFFYRSRSVVWLTRNVRNWYAIEHLSSDKISLAFLRSYDGLK